MSEWHPESIMSVFQCALLQIGSHFASFCGSMASQSQITTLTPLNQAGASGNADGEFVQSSALFGGPGVLASSPGLALLPVELDVSVPIRGFRVRNLIGLSKGQVIETRWVQGNDLPLGARGAQLAWTEFEVIDARLAVRISRLA
jgi:flagellar motor switch protein FliN/FliY